jgi:NADH-quinone oxidoreductase subunit E
MSRPRRFNMDAAKSGFSFKEETETKIDFWLNKYPEGRERSAVIPLLWLAQKDNDGWLSEPAMRDVADRLGMSYIRVYEVATFYTMFRLQPVGKYHVQVCGTTPCMLRGSDDIIKECKSRIGEEAHVSTNGMLSWEEVECLGACVNAPMVQVNDYYYEDLDADSFTTLLKQLDAGTLPEPGTRIDRQTSAPAGGMKTLTDESLYDGSRAKPLSIIPRAPEVEQRNAESSQTEDVADEGTKPVSVELSDSDTKDDLKLISGIGPKIESTLNSLGIFKFSQIADWTEENEIWVNSYLNFKGRIKRENWISQAQKLAHGEEDLDD